MLRCTVAWLLAAAAFALAHAGHLANPGYFSHDELQWGWRAQHGAGVDWLDNTVLQYRPLTFQVWTWIARWGFDAPFAYHALWVALGFGVCALLYGTLRRAGVDARAALLGAGAFALGPHAMYVHGWVATLAELLWTGAALGVAWVVFDARRGVRTVGVAAFVFTALALLAKETALAIPALCALAVVLARDPARRVRWLVALVASLVPAAVYLALRLPVLIAPGADSGYAWSFANAPMRVAEFHAWPLLPTALEYAGLEVASPLRLALAASLAALLLACVLRADARIGIAMLAGTAIALGPAIVLATGYPQYGYAASALAWACVAGAWPAMRAPARAIVVIVLVANAWHGINVQREMRRVGRIEATLTPPLRVALATPGDTLVLVPERAGDAWIYERLAQRLPYARRRVEVRVDPARDDLDSHDGDVRRIDPDGALR